MREILTVATCNYGKTVIALDLVLVFVEYAVSVAGREFYG